MHAQSYSVRMCESVQRSLELDTHVTALAACVQMYARSRHFSKNRGVNGRGRSGSRGTCVARGIAWACSWEGVCRVAVVF